MGYGKDNYNGMMAKRYQDCAAWDHRLGFHALLRGDEDTAVYYQSYAAGYAAKSRLYLEKLIDARVLHGSTKEGTSQ
jgi:hypothetical protein